MTGYEKTAYQEWAPVSIIFSLPDGTEVLGGASLPSGSGSASLTPGTWPVWLSDESNVISVEVNFTYQYTTNPAPLILKQGNRGSSSPCYTNAMLDTALRHAI